VSFALRRKVEPAPPGARLAHSYTWLLIDIFFHLHFLMRAVFRPK
jgi:hypothetical protein